MSNYSPDFATLAIEQMQDPQACLWIALQDPCGDPRRALEAMIAAIDRKLSNQIRPILHHPDFQQLEGAWRGLYFLVNSTEINNSIKIKALTISKKELHKVLKIFKGPARERGPLFLKIFHESYSVSSGEPFSCLIGDYYFDHSPQDVEMLAELSKICAISHTPFFGGAAASLVNFESWQDFVKQFSLNESLYEELWKSLLLSGRQYDAWHRLREIEESRYLNLVMPRCLARLPYGVEEKPNQEYMFNEEIQKSTINHKQYVWINAAYARGATIVDSFAKHGWFTRIVGFGHPETKNGFIDKLPAHIFPILTPFADEGIDTLCPTEVGIDPEISCLFDRQGLTPLETYSDYRRSYAFISTAGSLHKPLEFDDPDTTANSILSSRLNYLLGSCRFAQYLYCIARDHVGTYRNLSDMQNHLQTWLQQYVCDDPANATDEELARQPLAEARIVIEEVEHTSTYYVAKFFIRPVYDHGGLMTSSMRLLLRLPAVK